MANVTLIWRIAMVKKFVWWPFPVVTTLGYWYWKPVFLQMHNKKFFDMCNVGE